MNSQQPDADALSAPLLHLDIGITGHRGNHPVFSAHQNEIEKVLAGLLDKIGQLSTALKTEVAPCKIAPIRLHSLLAYGADLMSVKLALARKWNVVAPLPFGLDLNIAVNAQPENVDDITALLTGGFANDTEVAKRVADIRAAASSATLFELAEQDQLVEDLFRTHVENPGNQQAKSAFQTLISERAAFAARVMIEQSDIVIGIWDGKTQGTIGGTRHTMLAALDLGVPVIWIDAGNPREWRILTSPESMTVLEAAPVQDMDVQLAALVGSALNTQGACWSEINGRERWRPSSSPLLSAYRRIETIFGEPAGRWFKSLRQQYEAPADIVGGSGGTMLAKARALPGVDTRLVDMIAQHVLRPFAWADGVSTYLSDAFRGSMVASFLLSALAIIGGISYMPLMSVDHKWGFAAFEFALLVAIVAITFFGRKLRWHGRWFETRRVAEYFRHAPILLLLGVSRSVGRWPGGPAAAWPEQYALQALGNPGLPKMVITQNYLRECLILMLEQHMLPQRDYHLAKAKRLKRVHHNLDKLSEWLFVAALVSVASYLLIVAGAAASLLPENLPHDVAKTFTFLGVLFPTLGGAFAGIRYFGDFERFASISEITATKLDNIAARAAILISAPLEQITYAHVSSLAHAIDEVVVTEIENWQAVFGGKNISVPV